MLLRGCHPSNGAPRVLSAVLLVLSLLVNVVLLGVIVCRFVIYHATSSGCPATSLQQILQAESKLTASYPYETGHLSHLVLVMHESGRELEKLAKGLQVWRHHPPCLHSSYPTSWAAAHVNLAVCLDSPPTEAFAKAVQKLYDDLPKAVRSCFASFEIRHAGLNTTYASVSESNPYLVEDIRKLAQDERAFLSAFLANRIGLKDPSYALLLTPDTIPVQSNWLNLLDYETRIPVERFWIKGSLFRGNMTGKLIDYRDRIAFNRVALYNLGDPALSSFYETAVRPFIAKLPDEEQLKPWEFDWSNYLFRLEHYDWVRVLASMLRPTDAIQDHTGCAVDLGRLRHESPDTLLVRLGEIPDLVTLVT